MRVKAAVLLISLMSSVSVSAGQFVIGGNIGVATGGENAASLNDQLEANGFTAEASTTGDIRTGWQTYIAYQHEMKWGIQLAYVDLGEATVRFDGIEVPIDELLDGIGDNHPRSAQGVKLSATYHYDLNKKLQLQGRLGGFDWDTEYTFDGVNVDGDPVSRKIKQEGTNVSVGAGLVHTLTNYLSAHLDWDYYSIDEEAVNMFTLGISYRFY